MQLAPEHAPDAEAANVIVVRDVGDQHRQRAIGVVLGPRHLLENHLKQGRQVLWRIVEVQGGLAVAPGHGEQALERRAVAAFVHRPGLLDGHVQQLVLVRHDGVAPQQVAELARIQRAHADLGHGGGREAFGQKGQQVLAGAGLRVLGRAAGDVGQAAGARHQAHADFDQADVALHDGHALRAMHRHLAASPQRHAADGGHGGHVGVAQAQHQLLQFLFHRIDQARAAGHVAGQHGLQVGTDAERVVARPDN